MDSGSLKRSCARALTIAWLFICWLAIKSRIGDDVSRFATKKHLCSYAGVVPKANNSGEYISKHNHVKQGDIVLKYALTCAVRGAVLANKNSSIKLFYRKISKKGVSPQKAQIAAARKVACIVWKVLSSKQPYTEQDDHMTKRNIKIMSSKAMRTRTLRERSNIYKKSPRHHRHLTGVPYLEFSSIEISANKLKK